MQGARNEEKGFINGLHSLKFDFNEDIFYYALSTIYQMVLSI